MAALLVVASISSACSGPSLEVLERHGSGFLEREGEALYLDGRPFRFLGFTAFQLTGCGTTGERSMDDAAVDAFFASLRARSVIRTYALEPLGLTGLTRVVDSARRHGHLVALMLTDHLGSCGEGETPRAPGWYESGFRDTYLPWVRTVVSRFANDAVVAFWEPVKASRDVDPATLRTFFDVVGGEIHHLDPHHLVESGTHAAWAYGGDAGYQLILESAGIDVASFIDYDNAAGEFQGIDASVRAAAAVGKPLVLTEAGMFASKSGDPSAEYGGMTCITWSARRSVFQQRLLPAYAAGLDGVLVWNFAPTAQTGCGYDVSPGDPLFDLVRDF